MARLRRGYLRNIVVMLGLVVLVLVLTPMWLLHDAWSRRRRTGGRVGIPRVAASETSVPELLAGGRPLIVEGFAHHIGAPAVDLADLREVAARQPAPVDVEFNDPANPYFLYTGDYGREVAHREEMSLDELLDLLFEQGTGDEVEYRLFGPKGVKGSMGELIDEISTAIGRAGGGPTLRNASGIWIGSPGAVTPLHHDAWPGLLFQTEGRKSVTMFEPGDRGKLYFNCPLSVGSRWSRLPGRSAEADPAEFPRFAGARRYTAVLEPGDVLYIPMFWAHEMEALTANISIPLRLRSPRSRYRDPGFLRPAAEVLDGKLRATRQRPAA
jgi:hypothetical protein